MPTIRSARRIAPLFLSALAFFGAPALALAQNGETLQQTKDNYGVVRCGVSQGLPGFSNPDSRGQWEGIDVDLCRAVAAAIFGNANKVKFTPTSAKERFAALQSGEFDILSRNTTWTMQRDTALGLDFIGTLYYDGQGFMVPKTPPLSSAKELDGATVCTNAGTTTELNVGDFFRANNMKYELITFEKADEVVAAYDSERCDVYTTDQSALYANRLKLRNPENHIILPEIISKEPLGPVVRQGDPQWADIVRWTLFAMINAEELGVTSENVDRLRRQSQDPKIRRLLGREGSFGESLGLSKFWAYQIIKKVGNYGEVFEKSLGVNTPLRIQRGQNALWKDGGFLYAPPVR